MCDIDSIQGVLPYQTSIVRYEGNATKCPNSADKTRLIIQTNKTTNTDRVLAIRQYWNSTFTGRDKHLFQHSYTLQTSSSEILTHALLDKVFDTHLTKQGGKKTSHRCNFML